ncbi:MAG TPA: peptidoglycan-binding domain-containing protein, partial [Acetobacteraceae bacterium]|nr:peptidoglycan-binding domain-containing protein [Acetobacteraceae bacterium]
MRGLLGPRTSVLPWVVAILQVGSCAIPTGAAAQFDWMYQNLAPYAAPPPPRYAPTYPPAYPGYSPPGYYVYRAPPAKYRSPAASADRKLVAELQQMLDDLGYDAGAPDGSAGPQTAQALRAFQRDHGQPASGVITPAAVASVRSAWLDRRASAQPGPAAPGQAAAAPSFDCAHAGTAPEHTICNDSRLAQLDVAVADA